jgi:hypothetical protein
MAWSGSNPNIHIPKFVLSGEDPYGTKSIVTTNARETAESLMVSWAKSGFINVKMTGPDGVAVQHQPMASQQNPLSGNNAATRAPGGSIPTPGSQGLGESAHPING